MQCVYSLKKTLCYFFISMSQNTIKISDNLCLLVVLTFANLIAAICNRSYCYTIGKSGDFASEI